MIVPNPIVVPLTVSGDTVISLNVAENTHVFPLELATAINTTAGAYYEGPYEITSRVNSDLTLETEGKKMSADVVLHKVPTWQTSNEKGITFYIGND